MERIIQSLYCQGLLGNTTRTYDSGKCRYLQFCWSAGLPVSERTLCWFVAHLVNQNLHYSSVRTYLSAVRHLQISAGLPDLFTHGAFPQLAYTLRGAWPFNQPQRDSCLPISPDIHRLLHHAWSDPSETYESRLLWVASCLGFFGFLRVGEFTARSASLTDPNIVSRGDVACGPGHPPPYLRIHLQSSKTDPYKQGVFLSLGFTGKLLCPVSAILSFLAVCLSHLSGPLLQFPDGCVLTRSFLVHAIRLALEAHGVNASHYSGHSFRIGAAKAAVHAVVPDHIIRMLGRWESSAYTVYISTPGSVLAGLSARIISQPTQRPAIAEPTSIVQHTPLQPRLSG